jgi:ribosomal protein L4
VLRVEGSNIYDLLAHDYLICTREALLKLQERVAS